MKFKFYKTSTWKKEKEIDIISIEDLKNLQKQHGISNPLIIDFRDMTIEYYDDYRE